MAGKDKQTTDSKFELIKRIGYVLVIVLVFSPLTFLLSNTLHGTVQNDCYRLYSYDVINKTNQQETQACEDQYQQELDKHNKREFFTISIISIITILALLFLDKQIDPLISYSLFFASSLNTIIIVIKHSSSSTLAAGLGIILFVLLLIFINKKIKR